MSFKEMSSRGFRLQEKFCILISTTEGTISSHKGWSGVEGMGVDGLSSTLVPKSNKNTYLKLSKTM